MKTAAVEFRETPTVSLAVRIVAALMLMSVTPMSVVATTYVAGRNVPAESADAKAQPGPQSSEPTPNQFVGAKSARSSDVF